MICSISSFCDSESLQLHSTVKLIFSCSKVTDRWQSARLSVFFWQHSRRRHLVRLLVRTSTGFQPNTKYPLRIPSLHAQTALACVIHNTASSVPLYNEQAGTSSKTSDLFSGGLWFEPWSDTDSPDGCFPWFSHSLHAKCRNCDWFNSVVAKRFHRQYKENFVDGIHWLVCQLEACRNAKSDSTRHTYRNQKFLTVFTRARYWVLYWKTAISPINITLPT